MGKTPRLMRRRALLGVFGLSMATQGSALIDDGTVGGEGLDGEWLEGPNKLEELLMVNLPEKVTGVYWTQWNPQIRLTQVPESYNLQYLFAAPRGVNGAVTWNNTGVSGDIKTCRARGQRILLSCGGAGNGINFDGRTKSQNFVNSIIQINQSLGGTNANPVLDGLDFNTFEAEAAPNDVEYIWIGKELKRIFGAGFAITSPPAPWSERDKTFCRAMLNAGAMDYAAPQFYDGPGLSDPSYIINNTGSWVRDVAGGDASKIVVGFGIAQLPNYSTVPQIITAWTAIKKAYPAIKGAFLWQHATDAEIGWEYAKRVNPLILEGTNPTPPIPPPVITGDKVIIGKAEYALAGTDIKREADALVAYTSKSGANTGQNQYGAEATVVGGKVTAIDDRQTTGNPAVAIPKDGYVLSGHGAARLWLLENAKVGATVKGDVPGSTPEPGPEPTPDQTVKIGAATHKLNGVDVYRDADQLIQYTPKTGTTTGANQYGTEVTVVKKKITKVANNVGNAPIPAADGYVLSGHGESQQWLMANAVVGATVEIVGGSTPPTPTPDNPYIATADNVVEKHNLLVTKLRADGVI